MKTIINFFREDIWRKLLALALTCLLYWNLSDRKMVSQELVVPVDVEVESGLFLPKENKYDVAIVVTGTERGLRAAKIRGRVKVSMNDRQKDGSFRIKLEESNFERRRDISIISIKPGFIEPAVRRYISRDVPVKLRTRNSMSPEFRVTETQCIPEQITIRGPEDEISSIREIETEVLDLNCDHSFSKKLALRKPLHMVNSELKTSGVEVTVNVEKVFFERKTFTRVPVRFLYPPVSGGQRGVLIKTSVDRVSVEIDAPKATIDKINPDTLFVMADLPADLFFPNNTVDVKLYCPGVGYDGKVKISPESVNVTILSDENNNGTDK